MNRNYNGLLVLFFVALLTSALFGGGPEPRIPVGSADIADDSVTNAKLAEPVSVANGGTGKTTAAAGLAALGGASLNGSSTVDFLTKGLNASGFTKLGELGTGTKTAIATGTTSAVQNGVANVAIPMEGAKIVGFIALVSPTAGTSILPGTATGISGYEYAAYAEPTQIVIWNSPTNSSNILEKPVSVLIWYKE